MSLISKVARLLNNQIGKSNNLAFMIYKLLPSNNILFGKDYRKLKKAIDPSKPPQVDKLDYMLKFAKQHVSFYKKHQENYADFPFIDKQTIANQEKKFFSSQFKENDYELITSGGTSGITANYYSPKRRYIKEYAYFHHLWEKLGYTNQLRGVIRNTRLPDSKNYKINPITREVVFDAFRNTDDYFLKIYHIFTKYKLQYLQAYPSSAFNFLNFCYHNKLDISFIKGLFFSSEEYSPYQQEFFENTLKLNVISVYGHAERLIFIYRDSKSRQNIILNQYGFFDLIDENDKSINKENEVGEIVGTSLDNFGFPLIKYKTGDYSFYSKINSPGNNVLGEIYSRRQDLRIYNHDGSYVSPTALNMHGAFYTKIKGMQYYQDTMGEVVIRIVKNQNYKEEDELFLKNYMQDRFANNTILKIEYVDKLQKTSSGKNKLLISIINEKT